MTDRLKDKVAFITGATSGIGRGIAVTFAREGASVVFIGRRENEGAETLAMMREAGGKGLFIQADVTEPDQLKAAIDRTVAEYGRLDVLVNAAGGSPGSGTTITETSDEEFWHGIKLNLYGVWSSCRMALPHMIANGRGSIINVSSVLAIFGSYGRDTYTAAKGGVSALTRALAYEYAPHKIRANTVIPGVTPVERYGSFVETEEFKACLERIPLGATSVEEMANAALFLATDECLTITGQEIVVDGGMAATRQMEMPRTVAAT